MDALLPIIGVCLAISGMFLIGDFIFWEIKGHKTDARIEDFQIVGKFKVPIVSFLHTNGKTVRAKAARWGRISHFFSPGGKGDMIGIIYRNKRVRIYGYAAPAAGMLLLLPAIAIAGILLGRSVIVAQSVFALLFLFIIIAGPVLLKLLQRGY